jgi:hypothetical protein
MMLSGFGVGVEQLKNDNLARLVRSVQSMTRGSYQMYNQNYESLSSMLKKILQLSKQEKEWYLYFETIDDLLNLNSRVHNYAEIVKYAEIYYKDYDAHMEAELPNYPNTLLGALNTWIYEKIFEAYYEYYQIDDAKMEIFLKRYEQVALQFGKEYTYYSGLIKLGMLYRDMERTQEAARKFLVYADDMARTYCYVCGHFPYLGQLLLTRQDQKAEELMLKMLHKNIPQKYQWCYRQCEMVQLDAMYVCMLCMSVRSGRIDAFHYFYKKYWSKLERKNQCAPDNGSFQRLMGVYGGYFDRIEEDLQQALDNIKDENKHTTIGNMYEFLQWWCYFCLVDKGGIHKISIALPELELDENGQVSTLEFSDYLQKKADIYGRKFAQVRAKFDYDHVKADYQEVFLEGK